MALRLRRDVQKASYYVWFLGAEEAKGLRGERVINSVLPYLIDRSRGQEPLKVTLQVSHKGIKILQGSSKHFIPHSAITSSVQTDDIVACVLLLYNPATKCPLHVHAYRCDSETTAETLHQQLQILINRPDNQKRFEELETRLGILPQLPTSGNKSISASHIGKEAHSQKPPSHFQSQQKQKSQQHRQDTSPKRFSSSLGSDTGNSTRESECSEENSNASPISRSPPTIVKPSPLPQPTNELFDSLAAELRAKLNGNGPPILLPPRDYDTVHRSKGNLTAIELRRCRNALIVGGATPTKSNANGKQVSSRGSSGIGSDLAPSPERQDLNSSSDDEHWSNEADNSVIALKPSQIAMERTAPTIIPNHPQLNRKIAVKPAEDSYLRDLPAKPYTPSSQQGNITRDGRAKPQHSRDSRSKTPSSSSWSKEDDIKPKIVRPIDYDAKFHRVLQNEEQKANYNRRPEINAKLNDTDKYNEINRLLNKKLIIDHDIMEQPQPRYSKHKSNDADDYDDSDLPNEKLLLRKENLTDKQKFIEYTSKKQQKSYAAEEVQKYGGRHRYVDPADLPFDTPQPSCHNKYAAVHRGNGHSPNRSDLGQRAERRGNGHSPNRSDLGHRAERRGNGHSPNRSDLGQRAERHEVVEPERRRRGSREREPETERYARNGERNPYREPESIPYIQSMEKMMKSSAMRYKSYDGIIDAKDDSHSKISQRCKSYPKHDEEMKLERDHKAFPTREETRYNDSKEKIRPVDRSGSRYDLTEERDLAEYRPHRRGSMEPVDRPQVYHQEWSEAERRAESPIPLSASNRSRARSRDRWEQDINEVLPPRQPTRRDYARDGPSSKHIDHRRDERDHTPERYREQRRYDSRPHERESQRDNHYRMERPRDTSRDYPRDHTRRDYSPDVRSGSDFRPQYVPEKQHGSAVIASAKSLSNLAKGYRHSYAEPVFARGRVGLAAVNPY